jgi:hypothetical protein
MLKNNNNINLDSFEKRQAFFNLTANSTTSQVFKNDNIIIDFIINNCKNQLDEVTNFTLEMTITNEDVSNMSIIPTMFWVNNIEFYSNQVLLDSIRRDQIFVLNSFQDAFNVQNVGRLEGYTVDDNDINGGITNTITLAPNERRTYHILIPNNVFTTKHLLLPAIGDDFQLKIRCYFNSQNNIVTSVNVANKLIMSELTLLCNGIKYDDVTKLEELIQKGFTLDTLRHRWESKNIVLNGGLDNNTVYDIELKQLSGDVELMFLFLQKTGANKQDYYQSATPYNYSIGNFELVDSNGTVSGFYSRMNANYIKSLIPLCCQNSLWQSLFSFYMLPFSTDPEKTYKENAHVGCLKIDGLYSLRFQPNLDVSLADTNMNLVYVALQRAKLFIKNGILSIQ